MSEAHSTTPLAEETWKPIPGFEGWYSVSDAGRIRRDKGVKGCRAGRIRKPGEHNSGYYCIVLSKNGIHTSWLVHRLVLAAFVGPSPEGKNTNHKDGNKRNNLLSNLEYVTLSENQMHRRIVLGKVENNPNPLFGEKHQNSKLTEEIVREIRRLYATGEHFQWELGERFGIAQTTVGMIVRRKAWPHVA